MGKEDKFLTMATSTWGVIQTASHKGKDSMSGRSLDAPLKDHFAMVNEMVKASGPILKEINMLGDMWKTSSQAMASFTGVLATSIKAIFFRTKDRVMDKCFGAMGAFTRDSGIKECSTARESFILSVRKLI